MKECIEAFEVDVDISDCTRLYDYATCRKVTRDHREKWSNEMFKTLGGTDHVKEDDENLMLQVRMMDKAINHSGMLQKKMEGEEKEPEDCNFNSDFGVFGQNIDVPRRMLPVYHPGDTVKGQVKLRLNKAVQPEQLCINLNGEGLVKIWIYTGQTAFPVTKTETFLDADQMLWTKKRSESGKSEEFFSLVSAKVHSGEEIPAGEHSWPFEFQIPLETSQSAPNLLPSCNNDCYVIYRLKATLGAGKVLRRGDVVTHKGIWVEKPIDIAAEPENLNPLFAEDTLDTGLIFKSGCISIKAKLPRKAFVKGEEVPLSLEIDNQTSGAIKKVTAHILMHGKCRLTEGSKMTCGVRVRSAKMSMRDLAAGMCPTVDWNLPWDFSESSVDSNLMPTGTLDDCKLIDVGYDVMVKVKRSGLHRNMELQIPIFVGTFNSKDQHS